MTCPANPFSILAVCRGNISRSPVAKYLLRASLDERFTVSSAGTGAYQIVGDSIDIEMADLLAERDIDSTEHKARQLNVHIIESADLILTMARPQRTWIAEEVPSAITRAFTLKEFARLAVAVRDSNPKSVSQVVRYASQSRAIYPAAEGVSDDIQDPHGRSLRDYQFAYDEIEQCIEVIAPLLLSYEKLHCKEVS